MKAIAVHPGIPNSMHLRDVDPPRLDDVEGGRGVLVEIIRVGVDGTDKEINAAEYGEAPAGDDYLITGHENFGRVARGRAGGAERHPRPAAWWSRRSAVPGRASTTASACRT